MPRLPVTSVNPSTPEIGHVDALLARAARAEQEGRLAEAVRLYRQILGINPTVLYAINRLGAVSGLSGDLATATRQFGNSLKIDPNQPEAWFNLGVAQSKLGRFQDALTSFERVIALAPSWVEGHLERAATFARLGRHKEARTAFDDTVRLSPEDPAIAGQRGWTLQWCGEYEQALGEFDRAIGLRPDFAEAWVAKAMTMLLLGDLASGFALYQWRWRLSGAPAEPPGTSDRAPPPLWLGETDLAGKTLLIHAEQGLGDTMQFCRYATLAAKAGARVIVQAPKNLVRLLETLEGVTRVIADHEPRPEHDLHCPTMSLPLAFRDTIETIPASIPYLHADPSLVREWRDRLSEVRGLRVGLVWAGSPRFGHVELMATDQRRSMPLSSLAPLASIEGCSFVSLQLGPPAGQTRPPPDGLILHDHTSEIADYMDTAALVENLDLVIGVDTSVIHLAGAMGKPVWLLNRFDTCWRWLLDRDESPWYPTMRIFRQPEPGDWASVVRSVSVALRALAAA